MSVPYNYCVYLDHVQFDVHTPNGVQSAGVIDQCICGLGIVDFFRTEIGVTAVDLAGRARAEIDLTYLLQDYQTDNFAYCNNYNAGSVPDCTLSNFCGVTCKYGWIYEDSTHTSCICPVLAKGVICPTYPSAVSIPNREKRKRIGEGDESGFKWWEGALCEDGYTPCGIFEGHNNGWDCVDAQNDLESCGGCAIPLHGRSPPGTDCTTIPEVSDVVCMRGHCVVLKCQRGYQISSDGTTCEQPIGDVLASH